MSVFTQNQYPNRIRIGELNVGSGALGQYIVIPSSATAFTIAAPFYDGYVFEYTGTGMTLQFPVIGATGQVMPGWKTSVTFVSNSTGSGVPNPTITFTNSSGVTFGATNGIHDGTEVYMNSTIVFTAISAPDTWTYEIMFPSNRNLLDPSTITGLSTYYTSAGYTFMDLNQFYGKFTTALGPTNVNILYSASTVVALSSTYSYDITYYSSITGSNTINILVGGVLLIECSMNITNSGGGTSTNVQAAVRRNGVAVSGAMMTTLAGTSGPSYTLKVMARFNAGDTLTLVAGKSAVSAGTSSMTGYINIKYIG